MSVTLPGGSLKPRQASELITTILRPIGKQDVPTLRAQAVTYLNEVIDEINTYQPWEMLRTVDTDTAFTDATADYTLTTAAFKIEKVQVVDATTAAVERTVTEYDAMTYKDWDEFEAADEASVYYARNLHADNKISFKGTPGAGLAASSKFRVQYIKRMPLIAGEADVLDVPREFDALLVEGGKWLARDNSTTADKTDIQSSFIHYQRMLKRLLQIDRNHPDQNPRFRLGARLHGLGTQYIRV